MKKFLSWLKYLLKKDLMLSVSLVAAAVSLFITPPSRELINDINWRTLATLFMLLSVLEGFKSENIFEPLLRKTQKFSSLKTLTVFFVFCVFFSSMFVTNDVSLIIFVPLTIILFRAGGNERYILPVLTFENIAAIRGSLLTPFGSPQNLFLFSQSGMNALDFMAMMLPLWIMSMVLITLFILFIYRKNLKEEIRPDKVFTDGEKSTAGKVYVALFVLVVITIVSQTKYWPLVLVIVSAALFIFDRDVFRRVDYVLLLTFLCFFVFSSSVAANPAISGFLSRSVAGHEYIWSIAVSQVISNVPAAIVLWPFTEDLKALIYGLDSAGLVSIIGSLASVINLRLYTREYPGRAKDFLVTFEVISLAFFALVCIPQLLLI